MADDGGEEVAGARMGDLRGAGEGGKDDEWVCDPLERHAVASNFAGFDAQVCIFVFLFLSFCVYSNAHMYFTAFS